MQGLILIHAGAGFHSFKKESKYRLVCEAACKEAVKLLLRGEDCVNAVTAAIKVLEYSPLTNAGYGSNATLDGTVECDASVMDGFGHYGSIGAVQGVKNPIAVARQILHDQKTELPDGRIKPCCIVGDGASKWAKEHGIETVEPGSLLSEQALKDHKKYSLIIDQAAEMSSQQASEEVEPVSKRPKLDEDAGELLDTVGALCIDMNGRLAAGVSSGGTAMKKSGRIGQASMFGCGCWADDLDGTAVATTGCGEHLIKTLLAREIGERLAKVDESVELPMVVLHNVIELSFLGNRRINNVNKKLAGAIVLKRHSSDSQVVEVMWIHTTKSIATAYMCTDDNKPTSCISRLSESEKAGTICSVRGKTIRLQTVKGENNSKH